MCFYIVYTGRKLCFSVAPTYLHVCDLVHVLSGSNKKIGLMFGMNLGV